MAVVTGMAVTSSRDGDGDGDDSVCGLAVGMVAGGDG
jgi:hypothetical protein